MSNYVVLSVEDSEADFLMIKMALEECQVKTTLFRASDAEQAVTFLLNSTYDHASFPQLILLDVNMPRYDGFEVLRFIRSRREISKIPVVMFTSSSNIVEKRKALEMGADEFITKSSDFDQIVDNLRLVCSKHLA